VKLKLVIAFLALMSTVVFVVRAIPPPDISGTWQFSVDLESGGHGDPTFVFKQDKETLTGTYDGPLGQYNVTGTIKDNTAVFGFEFTNEDQKHKATYTGTVESATRMSGILDISDGPKGKWTAIRK
jgi:hypothetical protein